MKTAEEFFNENLNEYFVIMALAPDEKEAILKFAEDFGRVTIKEMTPSKIMEFIKYFEKNKSSSLERVIKIVYKSYLDDWLKSQLIDKT